MCKALTSKVRRRICFLPDYIIDHFEIWDLEAWNSYISKKDLEYEEKANSLQVEK